MTAPVSIVLPSLDTTDLLAANLPALFAEVDRRAVGDEVIVVDDTGRDALSAWMAEHFPTVLVEARAENGGFAQALEGGIRRARHDYVFSMNTDVRVRPEFLEPLVEHLVSDETVAAVVPQVLLDGDEDKIESLTEYEWKGGRLRMHMVGLDDDDPRRPVNASPVAFAVGGTCLFRREAFLQAKGFDPMYEPFYWEDVDYCWRTWRDGGRVLYEPSSIVEHHHRGTIGEVIPKEVVRAALERNTLLFLWKHLDDPARLREHLAELRRGATEAWIDGHRDELVWLNLALDRMNEALQGRGAEGKSFRTILEDSRPRA